MQRQSCYVCSAVRYGVLTTHDETAAGLPRNETRLGGEISSPDGNKRRASSCGQSWYFFNLYHILIVELLHSILRT